MKKAGIDYSINYPALVIETDNNYKFISFERKPSKLLFEFDQIVIPKNEDKLEDAHILNTEILKLLLENNVTDLNIEGFSFASRGQSYIDLIAYQTILRYLCFQNNINIHIHSPMTVKKTAGHGRFSKIEMFDSFLNNPNEKLNNSDFYKNSLIFQNKIRKNNKQNIVTDIKKPYQDLYDAYWCLRTGE